MLNAYTESDNQEDFCPFALREVSVLTELALGHLRYGLTDVPPQSNSPPEAVLGGDRAAVSKPQGLCSPRTLDSRNVEPLIPLST